MKFEEVIKQNFELKKENQNLRRENIKLKEENQKLKQEVKRITNALSLANKRAKNLEIQFEKYKSEEAKRIEEIVAKAVTVAVDELTKKHQEEVNVLQAKIKNLELRLGVDSTNSGTPTSKEPIGKHTIQNNREKTDRSIGSQIGHERHKLEYFKEEEITETIEHTLEKCPYCGEALIEENIVRSDIIDIKIKVTKTRNNIHNYKCTHCHKKVTANADLPRGVSYGSNVNAIALSMMNESNTALNKVTSFLSGITNGEVDLCEGYLVKLQKRNVKKLETFKQELREKVITLDNVFWDDTTVEFGVEKPEEGYDEKDLEYIENQQKNEKEVKVREGVIRFYGDDNWALLIGHRNKNKESVEDDGILEALPSSCVVMHDHLLINYNKKFSFQNAECNEHTKRYLNKNIMMFPEHEWANKMKKLLIEINNEKKELINKKIMSFTQEKLDEIFNSYKEIIKLGYEENSRVNLTYIKNKIDELNLIERLDKFMVNHLMFATNFIIEFSNNTSERGLRQVKRKLAVSFMFKNPNRMKDYAMILSYLETCHRNGISRFEAAKRLVENNPFTIKELEELITNKEKQAEINENLPDFCVTF